MITRSATLFEELGWKTFKEHVKRKRNVMTYKALNNLAPTYMKDMFTHTAEVHDYSLRSTSSRNLFIPRGASEYHRKRFRYLATMDWNKLPLKIKEAGTLNSFKCLLSNL